jgi:hypothetical protein
VLIATFETSSHIRVNLRDLWINLYDLWVSLQNAGVNCNDVRVQNLDIWVKYLDVRIGILNDVVGADFLDVRVPFLNGITVINVTQIFVLVGGLKYLLIININKFTVCMINTNHGLT